MNEQHILSDFVPVWGCGQSHSGWRQMANCIWKWSWSMMFRTKCHKYNFLKWCGYIRYRSKTFLSLSVSTSLGSAQLGHLSWLWDKTIWEECSTCHHPKDPVCASFISFILLYCCFSICHPHLTMGLEGGHLTFHLFHKNVLLKLGCSQSRNVWCQVIWQSESTISCKYFGNHAFFY